MSLQHIQKNSPRLLPKPAKFEKKPPNGYRVIRKTKCGAGGAASSPIHKQASLAGRLTRITYITVQCFTFFRQKLNKHTNRCLSRFEEAFVEAEIIAVQCLHLALKFPSTPWGMSNSLNTLGGFQSITLDISHY